MSVHHLYMCDLWYNLACICVYVCIGLDVSLSELRELVMDKEAWRAAINGVGKSRT